VKVLRLDGFVRLVALNKGRDHLAAGPQAARCSDLPELWIQQFVESLDRAADSRTQECAFEIDQLLHVSDYATRPRPEPWPHDRKRTVYRAIARAGQPAAPLAPS